MADTLIHPASFRDVTFPCTRISSSSENALVVTTYPHREGQYVVNLGRLGTSWEIEATFSAGYNGRGPYAQDLYPYGYLRFIQSLQKKERGYFDDPYHGRAWAQCAKFSCTGDGREAVRVQVSFIEANLDEPTYTTRITSDGGGSTEQGARTRVDDLDAMYGAVYPDAIERVPFSLAWDIFMAFLWTTDRVLTLGDMTVALNTLNETITTLVDSYPLIQDPLNWEMQYNISRIRGDAITIASRRASPQDKRIIDYKVSGYTSTLEMAIYLYGDSTRTAEIEQLNDIDDPLFVPPGVYKVVSP